MLATQPVWPQANKILVRREEVVGYTMKRQRGTASHGIRNPHQWRAEPRTDRSGVSGGRCVGPHTLLEDSLRARLGRLVLHIVLAGAFAWALLPNPNSKISADATAGRVSGLGFAPRARKDEGQNGQSAGASAFTYAEERVCADRHSLFEVSRRHFYATYFDRLGSGGNR
jgi:hypothetical protein